MFLRRLHICKDTWIILVFLSHGGCKDLQVGGVLLFELCHFALVQDLVGEHAGKAEVIE